MYKNQLQELAQRSCFNLPSYSCIREGPDHAPRFKATVNFNGEIFESPNYCLTLRQAEHSAAEVALSSLSHRGPSYSLAARILDETGVYKNLLQEISQRVGAPLPQYTTYRSGLGHLPVFTGTVELAGIIFTGDPAKNKKQAEKNAAMAAWSSLKQLAKEAASSSSETEKPGELEQITIARALLNYRLKEKIALADSPNSPSPYPRKFPIQTQRPPSPQPPSAQTSKILPLICPKTAARQRALSTSSNDNRTSHPPGLLTPRPQSPSPESRMVRPQKFPAPSATPYVPIRQFRMPCHAMAPPVTIRTAVPVFSAPPLPASPGMAPQFSRAPPVRIAAPVSIRQAVPVFAAPVVQKENSLFAKKEDTFTGMASTLQNNFPAQAEETKNTVSPPIQGSNNVCNFLQVQKEDPSASKREDPLAVKASTLPYKSPSEVDKTGSTNLNAVKEYEVIPSLERLKV